MVPVSDAQINLLKKIIVFAENANDWGQFAKQFDLSEQVSEAELRETLSGGGKGTASQLIDSLKILYLFKDFFRVIMKSDLISNFFD